MAKKSSLSVITRKSLRHKATSIQDETRKISAKLVECNGTHFSDLFKQFHAFQREGRFCDVVLKTADGQVPAHGLVLMASCPFFLNQLGGIHQDKSPTKCIDLPNMPGWVAEEMIIYLYTGQIQIIQSRVEDLMKHCKELGLKNLCEQLSTKVPITTKDSVGKDNVSAKIQTRNSRAVNNTANSCKDKTMKHLKSPHRKTLKRKRKANDIAEATAEAHNFPENEAESDIIQNNGPVEPAESVVNNGLKNESVGNLKQCGVSISMEEVKEITKERLKNLQSVKESKRKQEREKDDCRDSRTQDMSVDDVEIKVEIEEGIDEPGADIDFATDGEFSGDCEGDASDNAYDEDSDSNSGPENSSPELKKTKLAKEGKDSSRKNATKTKKNVKKSGNHCKNCDQNFLSVDELKLHRKECKGNRPRKRCILCKISFDTAEDYIHHRNTDEKCLEIRKEIQRKRLKRKAQYRSRFACRVCPRKFRRVSDLIDHEFTAHDLPYDKTEWPDLNCEWCSYWTMNPWRLRHHQTYDCSKGQEYICDMCGNKYKNEKTLKCHREMMHTDALPMLKCELCDKVLKGPKGLQQHVMTMHKGGNPHKRHMCHLCSMTYTSNNDLTFHLYRVHKQSLPDGFIVYNCTKCDYTINNKRTYQKHLFLHEDRRDWQCERCPKAFKTRNTLNGHMKSHTGNKMSCPYEGCGYGALKKCHLKTHIENKHTLKGMKNEQCHMCSYSTFFKGNLLKHLRSVHQLEVVTRYTVEMKAKYKNCKSGQIIGTAPGATGGTAPAATGGIASGATGTETKTKSSGPRQNSSSNKTKSRSQPKADRLEDKAITAGGMAEEASNSQLTVVTQPVLSVDSGSMHIAVPVQAPPKQQQHLHQSYMYGIGNSNITMATNIPNMAYTNHQDPTLAQQQTISQPMARQHTVPRPIDLLTAGNLSRDINMAGPSMYGEKMPTGVVSQQELFQPQNVEDVTKTYFQM